MTEESEDPQPDGHDAAEPSSPTELPPPGSPAPGEWRSSLGEVLERFKQGQSAADEHVVNDGHGLRPRPLWSPVTDSGGDAPPRSAPGEGFHFNLGTALAKLGIDPDTDADGGSQPGDAPFDALSDLQRRLRGGASEPAPAVVDAPAVSAVPVVDVPEAAPAEPQPLARRQPRATTLPIDDGPAVVAPSPRHAAPADEPLPTRRAVTPSPVDEPLPTRRSAAAATSQPAADEPLPTRRAATPPVDTPAAADEPLPTRRAAAPTPQPVVDEPLPTRRAAAAAPAPAAPAAPATPPATADVTHAGDVAEADVTARAYVTPRRSVFDDVVAPTPSLPPTITSTGQRAATPAVPTAAVAPSLPPDTTPAPTLPGGGGGGGVAAGVPTLPPAAPKVVPVAATSSDHLPETSDIRALRSAQLRAQRQARRRHPVLRGMLLLIVLGAIGAAAVYFGRPFLFPTEWDPVLTPIVDEIESERGDPFEHTVGLVQQSPADFELTVMRLTVGDEWVARLPEWRALGLAEGDPTPASVAATLASGRFAVYDAAADRIYMPAAATPAEAGRDLRLALEQAYDAQAGLTSFDEPAPSSFAGVSSPAEIARRAVDEYLVDGSDGDVGAWRSTSGMPAPIAYELLAADVLGSSILRAAGVDPALATYATADSGDLAKVLTDDTKLAEAGALQVGERALAEPVALGMDDWSLVWGQRLAPGTVAQLAAVVVADAYRPIDRNGATCAIGVFETPAAAEADVLLVELTNWVNASPIESQASATKLADNRVQLVTCDPGPAVDATTNPEAVRAVVERQLGRLNAVSPGSS